MFWKGSPLPGAKSQKFDLADLEGVALGSIVKAKGSINQFRGVKQVLLRRITVLKDTNEEVAAWAETTRFKRNVLLKPWVVSDEVVMEEQRKLTQTAEDEERQRERRRRKKEKKELRALEREGAKVYDLGKENMLWDSLVEKQSQEEWPKRKKSEGQDILSPKRQRTVEPDYIPETSYRGHLRPSSIKLPSPPHQPSQEREETPPAPISTYRGRRRITPAPPNPLPIPSIQRDPTPELPTSSYRGKRRTHPLIIDPLPEPEPYSDHLQASKQPSPPAELAEHSTYRGRRRIKKTPAEALALQELVSSLAPESRGECTSYRDLRRLLKAREAMAVPEVEARVESLGFASQDSMGGSSYRGRRRQRAEVG